MDLLISSISAVEAASFQRVKQLQDWSSPSKLFVA